MIEVASEINSEMPGFVVQRVADALNDEAKAVRGSRVLILGVAYKRDVGDMRESTAFEIMHLLQARGAHLLYHDALCPVIDENSSLPLEGLPLHSVDLSDDLLAAVDAVVIVTDHSGVDYGHLAEKARLVIDTRGVMRRYVGSARVIGLSGKELSLHGTGVTTAA